MSRIDPPEVRQSRGSATPTPGKCGQKLVWTNPPRYCLKSRVPGRTRCELHGGKTPTGIANAKFKGHGMYSAVLPDGQRKVYEALLQDADLLSLKHEISLVRSQLTGRLADLRTAAPVGVGLLAAIEKAVTAWTAFEAARTAGTGAVKRALPALTSAMAAVRTMVDPARRQADAFREVRADVGLLERLERSENQHIDELYNRIDAQRAFALRVAETEIFLAALDELVTDAPQRTAVRRRVAAKFAELTGRRDSAPVAAGGGSGGAGEPGDGAAAADGRRIGDVFPADVGVAVPADPGLPRP